MLDKNGSEVETARHSTMSQRVVTEMFRFRRPNGRPDCFRAERAAPVNTGGCDNEATTDQLKQPRIQRSEGPRPSFMVLLAAITAMAEDEADSKWWNPPELSLSVIVPVGQRHRPPGRRRIRSDPADVRLGAQDPRDRGEKLATNPARGSRTPGWLVFDDPDGCPSFMELLTQAGAYHGLRPAMAPAPVISPTAPPTTTGARTSRGPAPRMRRDYLTWLADVEENATPWAFDETWVEFFSGISVPDQVPPEERETPPQVWMHTG